MIHFLNRMRFTSRTLRTHHIFGRIDVLDRCLRVSAEIGLSTLEHVAGSRLQGEFNSRLCITLQQNLHDARTFHGSRHVEQ